VIDERVGASRNGLLINYSVDRAHVPYYAEADADAETEVGTGGGIDASSVASASTTVFSG